MLLFSGVIGFDGTAQWFAEFGSINRWLFNLQSPEIQRTLDLALCLKPFLRHEKLIVIGRVIVFVFSFSSFFVFVCLYYSYCYCFPELKVTMELAQWFTALWRYEQVISFQPGKPGVSGNVIFCALFSGILEAWKSDCYYCYSYCVIWV